MADYFDFNCIAHISQSAFELGTAQQTRGRGEEQLSFSSAARKPLVEHIITTAAQPGPARPGPALPCQPCLRDEALADDDRLVGGGGVGSRGWAL